MSWIPIATMGALAFLGGWTSLEAEDPVPTGVVTQHVFAASHIFPGTVRDYWVYVPKQYDGSKPACVFIDQDGVQFKAPEVFDRLIAAGEMPVTIGIFVAPGRVPAPTPAALDRFNRSYEYDGMGDDYARFLLEELLPHIAADQHLELSAQGNDRCIAGSSSGAICAFTAAWRRPREFSRVFSAIGTYVGLRGGNEYPTLIRKSEPHALRVFLQDGSKDLNIYGGDWWMANQEMERALTFAGYEVEHAWGDGGHEARQATEVFADAMRFLWRGWPAPVPAGLGSTQMKEILIPGESWQLVGSGYRFSEGPAVDAHGTVFFNDIPASITYRLDPDGTPRPFLTGNHQGDGQRFGPDGRLYAVAGETKEIIAYDPAGKPSVIASGLIGNDLVVRHDGGIYVTEPNWDGHSQSTVWFIATNGQKTIVDTGLRFCNGLTFSPDQSLLYVDDTYSHWVYSYQVHEDGTLSDKQRYFHLHDLDDADDSGADGMRVDSDGRLYVATHMGIQVCDQAGRVIAIIPTPNGQVANITFGGPDLDTLFAACGDKVFKRKLKVHGVEAAAAPVKPPPPHL